MANAKASGASITAQKNEVQSPEVLTKASDVKATKNAKTGVLKLPTGQVVFRKIRDDMVIDTVLLAEDYPEAEAL